MFKPNSLLARALLLLAATLAGCDQDPAPETDGRLQVVATTGMIGDLVKNLGGEHVRVHSLMGPGIDPHLYKASEGDVGRMSSADIIFYNGLHLEGAMAEVLERLAARQTTVAVAAAIDTSNLLTPPEFAGLHDPHIWFDVMLWHQAAAGVTDALTAADPDHAADYRAHLSSYRQQLDSLHGYVRKRAQSLPAERRVLVTAHDAFNYFGRAYDFEVRGLQGISTVAEAGTADVQDLAALIARRQIPALFVESSVPPRSIEAVQAAVRARGYEVRIGGELLSDAMGTAGTGADTYIGMVRHNIETIVRALREDAS